MIYEIRNYHFDPDRFEEYKAWARDHALPLLDRELDLVGFWARTDDDTEVNGAPMDDLGSANITWVIRWPNREARDAAMETLLGSEEWAAVFAHVPGGLESYRRIEIKYAEALL